MTEKITPEEALQRIDAAIVHEDVLPFVDFRKARLSVLRVYNPWEMVLPITGLMLLSMVLLFQDLLLGIIFLLISCLIHVFVVLPWVGNRVQDRVVALMVAGVRPCNKVWAEGVITLVMRHQKRLQCVSPDGDWVAFAQKYLAMHAEATPDPLPQLPAETPDETY